ncbi:MAG: hypothetical protein KatS3mg025_1260 [Bacteroidia bacterium]|nr:MAG: hypothetical protein KatS3mg025_1260 [Bacteroidia bacterium]
MSARVLRLFLGGSVVGHFLYHYSHLRLDIFGYHAWRQCQTMATAVSFYEEDMRIWNPRRDCRGDGAGIFRMEFPLFQWSMALFGKLTNLHPSSVGRAAAYVAFLIAIAGCYAFLRTLLPLSAALAGTGGFLWSPALFYYCTTPLPDILALALGLWGLALWNRSSFYLGAICLGMAAAVKLPYVLLWSFPLSHALRKTCLDKKTLLTLLPAVFLGLLLPAGWYAHAESLWKDKGLTLGLLHQKPLLSEYASLLIGYFVSLLPETLFGYALTLPLVIGLAVSFRQKDWPLLTVGIVLLLYTLYEMPTLKLVHDYYLLPWLVWSAVLIGRGLSSLSQKASWLPWVFLLIAPVGAWARMHHRWNPQKPGFNPDLLTYKKALQQAVPDSALTLAGVDESSFIYLYHLHKKGWCIPDPSKLPPDSIYQKAQFAYSDNRQLDSLLAPYISHEIGRWGTFRVFKLYKP